MKNKKKFVLPLLCGVAFLTMLAFNTTFFVSKNVKTNSISLKNIKAHASVTEYGAYYWGALSCEGMDGFMFSCGDWPDDPDYYPYSDNCALYITGCLEDQGELPRCSTQFFGTGATTDCGLM